MSTGFGYNKGKDGKYNTLNLTSYKGRSVDSSKHSGTTVRHGLQSLGKVASTRRVPPPASLPSLKSENLGNDPNVNLVPKDGSGWASKTETSQSQQQASQAPQESQQRQASATYSQPSMYQTSNQSQPANRNRITSASQSSGPTQQTWKPPQYSQAGNRVSGAAGGVRGHGITPFSDEFPTLGDTQKEQQSTPNEDKGKESQYGPGPSLRPQNASSWKDGGGRNLITSKETTYSKISSDEPKGVINETQQPSSGSQPMHAFDMPPNADSGSGPPIPQRPMSHPSMGQPIPPGQMPQFRPNMMSQFMYNNRYQHHGMGHPGARVRYPTGMHANMKYQQYNNEMRFHGMMSQGGSSQQQEGMEMHSIISQSDLKEFDKLEKDDEGGWAGMDGEVDYSEKLVFSDDEENGNGKKSSQAESHPTTSAESSMDRRPKNSKMPPRQAWGPQQPYSTQGMDPHAMQQWQQQQYFGMLRGPGPAHHPMDMRGKPHMPYDPTCMPPQGQPYPGGQMGQPHMYDRHPMAHGTRFAAGMSDPSGMERLSPGGDDEQWRKSDKEEALGRARKRREEEERRMEMQRRSGNDGPMYYPDTQRDPGYSQSYNRSEDEAKLWSNKEDDRMGYNNKRRTESESSDERRAMRVERLPGDGYGGYRPQPHPSAGSQTTGGRNLPPRLANQRQKQDMWQPKVPSSGYQSYPGYDPHWMGGGQPTHYKQNEPRSIMRPQSIMKRESTDVEGADGHESNLNSRKLSESSSQSFVGAGGETPVDERRSYSGRDFYRRDDKKLLDDKRSIESASPSTTSSDREQRLWDAGTSKRPSVKRQSSRDSPASVGSTGDTHLSAQKSLLSRSESGNKPVTRWGSNQSNKSVERDDSKPASVRPRRSHDKIKLRDFRVEGEEDEDVSRSFKRGSYKSGRNNSSTYKDEKSTTEHRSWNNESKTSKPIATVMPSTSTTTATVSRENQKNSGTVSITRDVSDNLSDRPPIEERHTQSARHSKSAWKHEATSEQTRDSWEDNDVSETTTYQSNRDSSEPKDNKRNKDRYDHRNNRGYYDERPPKNDRRYNNRDSRNTDNKNQRDRQNDHRGSRDDNRGSRGSRSDDTRYRSQQQEKPRRSNEDRYDNRNKRDGRDFKKDSRRHSEDDHDRKQQSSSSQQSRRTDPPMSQQSKPAEKGSTNTTSVNFPKQQMASVPVTNVWEERRKQMQKDADNKNTYIPKEEDKKRTLKETAPPPMTDDDVSKISNGGDRVQPSGRKSDDSSGTNRFRNNDSRLKHTDSYSEKNHYDKSYREGSNYRGSLSRTQSRGERKPREYEDRGERRGGRGRGRSRGSNYRGGRGRAQNSTNERSNRGSAPPRGRGGSRRNFRSSQNSTRTTSARGKLYSSKFSNDDDDYNTGSMTDGTMSESDDELINDGRRRRVGEASDADNYSSDESYSEEDLPATKPPNRRKQEPVSQDTYNKEASRGFPRDKTKLARSNSNSQGTFTARGEPSRRGRGRGAPNNASRGRGRGMNSGRGAGSAPPSGRGRRNDDYRENSNLGRMAKNGERGPQGGADSKRYSGSQSADRRRRKNKPDRPPRFKNSKSISKNDGYQDSKPSVNGVLNSRQTSTPPSDGGAINSSDVPNDEWETASDNSADFKKDTPRDSVEDAKRNEQKRAFANQHPPAGRGRGGRGPTDRPRQDKRNVGKADSQVYTVHSVNYSNPAAIEGALREASLNQEEKAKKFEELQKTKHEELFRLYDNNFAGVVNVDDLPDVAAQTKLASDLGLPEDLLNAMLDSTAPPADDDDGFTQVLSRRAQKKKQEEIRKKDKEDRMNEAVRKAKVEQQRQNRQKFFNKALGNNIAGGTSGSIKRSLPSSVTETMPNSDGWPNIDTWEPGEKSTEHIQVVTDVSISQHDSGVESSVPSSQRSSPGTEAKLSFSHFGAVMTSTSVITSICDHQVTTSSVVQSSADLASLMTTQQSSIHLPKSDYMSGLSQVSSTSQSPSRANNNPIGPIGNERPKISKRSDSVENIVSLFPTMNEKNVISFVADSSDDKASHSSAANLFSSEGLRNTTFSPFGEPPNSSLSDLRADVAPRPGFTSSFNQPDFSEEHPSSEASLPNPAYLPISSFSMSTSSASVQLSVDLAQNIGSNSSGIDRHALERQNFRHTASGIQNTSLQPTFMENIPSDISNTSQTILQHSKAGVKVDSDPPEDMTLTPQTPTNTNVNHTAHSLEGPIPAPIPMPPKHASGVAPGPDGDTKSMVRQTHDVNTNANGAGDMGLMTPTSPSIDLNLKMESARKAWENMPQSSSASTQQQAMHSFHQPATSVSEIQPAETSTVPSVTLSVTNSSEWKPQQPTGTATPSSESDESWRNSKNQSSQSTNQQSSRDQEFSKSSIVTSSEPSNSIANAFSESSGSSVMAPSVQQQQLVTSSYSNNSGLMYLGQPGSHSQTQRLATVQTISSSSLATNLHNMQQAYTNLPPDYASGLYSTQPAAYNSLSHPSHAAYNTQPRDFTPPVMLSSNAMGTSAAKPSSQNPLTLKPTQQPLQAAAVSGRGLPGYGAASAMQGLTQQTNLGSTPIALARPHGGAPSPAHPITYLPYVEQGRVVTASQPNVAVVNQAINAPQRPQSTSFYSQLSQTGSSFYPQQAASQLHRQQHSFQQSIPGGQAVSYPQGGVYPALKSPTPQNHLGLEHGSIWTLGNLQQNAAYQPIAPPTQRLRSDPDYSQSLQFYQPKSTYFTATNKVTPTSNPPTGAFGPVKSNAQASYGVMKTTQPMYAPKVSTPANHDLSGSIGFQINKYSMASTGSHAGKPYTGMPASGDWNKPVSSSPPQHRPSSVHGLLSRPFSSSTDVAYQQSPSNVSMSPYFQAKPQDMSMSARMNYPQQNTLSAQSYNPNLSGWSQSKNTGQGIMGSQPSVSLLGKGPRPPMPQSTAIGQRYSVTPTYQQPSNLVSPQQMGSQRSAASFQPKGPSSSGGVHTIPSQTSQSYSPSDNQSTHGKNKQSQSSFHKAPPVPTLVRGSGSNLVGKKPTFMPEEVIKSNQANERASLLQSLSSFFPDAAKTDSGDASESKDWSTQVANSEPLPKRRPGNRHPGIEKRKSNKDGKSGPIGSAKNLKRLQKNNKKEEPKQEVESIVKPVKKMTLADTKPKKGETAKIQLN